MFTESFVSASGKPLGFKIELDHFSEEDWDIVADVIGKKFEFNDVIGIPRGGLLLAEKLVPYAIPQVKEKCRILIVDDVCTTGRSLESYYRKLKTPNTKIQGVVIFARNRRHLPSWVEPMFLMHGCFADGF